MFIYNIIPDKLRILLYLNHAPTYIIIIIKLHEEMIQTVHYR